MEDKVTVGARLRQIMNENNLKQVDILNKTAPLQAEYNVRIAKNDLSQYVNDKVEPNQERLFILAKALGVNEPWLMGFNVPKYKNDTTISNIIEIKQTRNIPVVGTIACGDPILAQENISDTIPFPVELLPSGNLFFLKAQGNSMEPTIKEDALVLIRKQEEVENGEIAAVLVNGDTEATLKKVRKLGDTILLEAINEEYAPYLVNKENPARIIGKAIKVVNEL
ncbi:LexA family protein [Eremococcus coleocola]|uniref:LexA family protein n=1 Tax=Eremococcus coleocola TaxID=88132 RepID=UPI0004247D56|nr:S24 family peptidase [Eremococcus coleocola]